MPLGLLTLLVLPSLRKPLRSVGHTLGAGLFASSGEDLHLPLADRRHVSVGHPIFRADREQGFQPVAWVSAVDAEGVRVHFASGETETGPWRLVALAAARGLSDAWAVAVPQETASRLGRLLSARVERLLEDVVVPEIRAGMPAFLARVDPRHDPRAKEVLEAVGGEVAEQLRPFVDDLASHVTKDIEREFDLLDRVGLLWRIVRGDGDGLGKKLLPVAEQSVKAWWTERQNEVLSAVGRGVASRAGDLQAWLLEDVWTAAREELAEPMLEARRERLEREGEAAIAEVLAAVVRMPEGGFRTRFAAVVRARLLEKDEPLLLLERVP